MKVTSRSRVLWPVLFFAALFLFSSCAEKTKETPASGFERAFSDAGLRLLREKVSPRDFSLPMAASAAAAADPQLGDIKSLSSFVGKVVFLNFWATWCGPCVSEMPSMEVLYQRFKDQGLEILAVNCMEEQEDVLDFMANNGLTFPALLDEDGKVSGAYGIQAIPTTFLIDRDGKIILRLVGSIDWDTEEIHTAFETLLDSVS